MKNTPGTPSGPTPTAPGPSTPTEETAVCIQRIIEDAIKVGKLSGYTPQFVLQGISEAIVNDSELDDLAKTWNTPPLPAAVIAIPQNRSGLTGLAHSAPDTGTTDSSVPAKGMKLTKILQSTQDNRAGQSCVGTLIHVPDVCSAFRGCIAVRTRAANLLSWCASHAARGIAIGGGGGR
jgi:hypothetical protein